MSARDELPWVTSRSGQSTPTGLRLWLNPNERSLNLVDDGTLSAEGAVGSSNSRVYEPHAIVQHSASNEMINRAPTAASLRTLRCFASAKAPGITPFSP